MELLAPFPEQVTKKWKKEETETVVARNICATNRKTDKYVSDVENQDIMPKTRNARQKGKEYKLQQDEPFCCCVWGLTKRVWPKPNGDIRLCVDMCQANEVTERERFQSPTVEETLAEMNESKMFSKLVRPDITVMADWA